MIFITGATGNIGTELVPQLLAKGASLRVLTRNQAKVSHLDPAMERVIGDRHDLAVVRQALQGADKLFMLAVLFDKDHEADRRSQTGWGSTNRDVVERSGSRRQQKHHC